MTVGITHRISKTGVALDWLTELAGIEMLYNYGGGIDTVAQKLRGNPLLSYQETKAELLEQEKHDPEYCAATEIEYAVTEHNAEIVTGINGHAFLLNRAAREGRLTDKMYHRFYSHLVKLVRG